MTTREPKTSSVIKGAILGVLTGTHTAMPGIVTAYDATNRRADVQPALKTRDVGGVKSRARILGVPVLFPTGGGFTVTMPIAPGDEVLCVFSQRSIDRWKKTGGEVDPIDGRKFDASDALAIPASMSDAKVAAALATAAFFGLETGASGFTIYPDGRIAIGTDTADLLGIVDEIGDASRGLVDALSTAVIIAGPSPGTFIFDPATLASIAAKGVSMDLALAKLSTILKP
jgi:hypothetical protein